MKTLHTLKLNLHYLMFRRCFIFCYFVHVSACLSSDVLITSFKIKERELFRTYQSFGTSYLQELVLTFVPWEFWLSECKWHSSRRNEAKFHNNFKAAFSGISASLSLPSPRPPCNSRANLWHLRGYSVPIACLLTQVLASMSPSGEPFQKKQT